MIIEAKNNREVSLSRLNIDDIGPVCDYLQRLSAVTKSRFGPHGFDKPAVFDLYKQPNEYWDTSPWITLRRKSSLMLS